MSSQQYVSSAPSYPGTMDGSQVWEENYRRRARTMTRDYVNPNSTRLSHRRSRSADSRQQYSNRSNNNGRSRTNPPSYNFNPPAHQNPRAGCMNLIYPTEDEGRVTVAYDTSNQSLSQIPKPIAIYEGEDEDRTGRSLSRNSPSVNRTSRSQSPRRRPVTPSGIIDPYASGISSATKTRMRAQHHDYDHLKNSLIMFGDEPSSMGTGLSQEELLKRRDKEHTRETKKRGSPNRKRLVNLPTSLFNAHSSRQHQQQVQAQLYSRHQEEEEANFTPTEQAPRNIRKARSADEFDLPVAAAFPAASPIVTSYSSGYDPTTPQQHGFGTNLNFAEEPLSPDPPAYLAEEAAKRLRKAEPRGIRSSMIERLRNGESSSAKRWNIVPSQSNSRPRSRSQSPGRSTSRSLHSSPRYNTHLLPSNFPSHQLEPETDDGSTDYQLEPQRQSLDPPTHSMSSFLSNDSNDFSFTEEQPQDIAQFSINGVANEDVRAREAAAHFLTSGREIVERSKRSYARDSVDFKSSKVTHSVSPLSTAYPQVQPQVQPSTQRSPHLAVNTSDSFSNSRESSDFNVGPFDPFGGESFAPTPTTRKQSAKYVLEPKDYSKITSGRRTNLDSMGGARRNSVKSQVLSSAVKSMTTTHEAPAPSDIDYRQTKAYQQFNENFEATLTSPSNMDTVHYTTSTYQIPEVNTPGVSVASKPFKPSPTSVADFHNPNVRWSDNLDQKPTPRKIALDKPKSILRKGGSRTRARPTQDCPSDEVSEQVRPEESVQRASSSLFMSDNPNDTGFLDHNGRALSPISNEGEEGENMEAEDGDRHSRSRSTFERNIPEKLMEPNPARLDQERPSPVEVGGSYSGTGDVPKEDSDEYKGFIEAVASVVVQTAARQFLAKLRVNRMRNSRKSSKQALYRKSRTKRPMMQNRQVQPGRTQTRYDVAATTIQRLFRGWFMRDCMTIESYCATVIQKSYRAWRARRKFIYDRYRVITVQSIARRKMSYDVYATCMYCVVAIQAAFRGYRVRKVTNDYLKPRASKPRGSMPRGWKQARSKPPPKATFRQALAATKIQAHWRSFHCEMAFLRTYESILLVQSIVRGYITRRLIRSWLRAHNIKASSRLMGETPRRKRQVKAPYNLPSTYQNHAAFMKKSLPAPLEAASNTRNEGGYKEVSSPDRSTSSSTLWNKGSPSRSPARNEKAQDWRKNRDSEQRRAAEIAAYELDRNRRRVASLRKERIATTNSSQQSDESKDSSHFMTARAGLRHVDSGDGSEAPFDKNKSNVNSGSVTAGMSDIDKRRKHNEISRKKALEENKRRDAETLSHAEEIKERRRKMEMKAEARRRDIESLKSPVNSVVDTDAGPVKKSASVGEEVARPKASRSTILAQARSFEPPSDGAEPPFSKKPSISSDKGMAPSGQKMNSATSHGASRVLAGWRSRENQDSGSASQSVNLSTPAKQMVADETPQMKASVESPAATLPIKGRNLKASNKNAPYGPRNSIHDEMRGCRLESEQSRLDQMHEIFVRVGLMASMPGGTPSVSGGNQIVESIPSNDSINDEKKEELEPSLPTTLRPPQKWKVKSYEPNVPVTTAPKEVAKSVFNSNTSNLKPPVELENPEEEKVVTPEPERKTAPVPSLTPNPQSVPVQSQMSMKVPELTSAIHIEMRTRRSENEQRHLDAIHQTFLRVGLMGGRQKREVISFSNTTSSEYEQKNYEASRDDEERASYVRHNWEENQNKPQMLGKLF